MLFEEVKAEVSLAKLAKSRAFEGINVDFYVPSINTVIEVHGVQHYKPSSFGRDNVDTAIQYTKQLNRDDRLRNVCLSRGIKVVEIPYDYTYTQILVELTECANECSGN